MHKEIGVVMWREGAAGELGWFRGAQISCSRIQDGITDLNKEMWPFWREDLSALSDQISFVSDSLQGETFGHKFLINRGEFGDAESL